MTFETLRTELQKSIPAGINTKQLKNWESVLNVMLATAFLCSKKPEHAVLNAEATQIIAQYAEEGEGNFIAQINTIPHSELLTLVMHLGQ